jgi:hypothetical protein
MPEHLRSLIYIILLALLTFFIAKKVTASVVPKQQFNRWRNTWIAITFIAFLAGNFWIYVILSALLLSYARKNEPNPFAFFVVLLFALPKIGNNIPGFGLINFLFSVDYITILSLTVLLPAYLSLRKEPETEPFLSYWTDKLLLAYIILDMVLLMRDTTVTDAMRASIASFTEMFLPYYVASRSIKHVQQFKEVIAALVIAAMVTAVAGMFEYTRHWLLYANLKDVLGVTWEMGAYLGRGDSLRALTTLGQPIILGYLMVVAIGGYLFFSKQISSRYLRWLGWAILLGGLYAPISRGPWIGALVLITTFIAISPNASKNLTKLAIAAALFIPLLTVMPGGQKIINLLPFIGHTDSENVDYRVRLIDSAEIVFHRYPLFGSTKFYKELAALGMTQGEGIVDVVNTYLFEVLEHGLVGLSLFIGFFSIIIIKMISVVTLTPDKSSEANSLGRALLASLIATMVTITTVSSILVLPIIYWVLAGVSLAYIRMIEKLDYSIKLAELQSYRMAFDVLPKLPATRLAFSAFTTHRVVVDTKPIPRVAMTTKVNVKEALKTVKPQQLPTNRSIPQEKPPIKTTKPQLGSLYHLARKNRPTDNAAAFEKTILLPVKPKVMAEEPLVETGMIKVLTGTNTGRELVLSKVLTKLGKTDTQVAIITRRNNGYFISHLEGASTPIVNNVPIGERTHRLSNHDVIDILGIKMKFFSDATH